MTQCARVRGNLFLLVMVGCALGCSEGSETAKVVDPAGAVCTPEKAEIGQKIACRVGGDFNDACTVFFGNSPLEAGEKAAAGTYLFNEERRRSS